MHTRHRSLFDVNFHPVKLTAARLEERIHNLVAELYGNEGLARRHRRFVEMYGERFREAHALKGTENQPPAAAA